MARKTMTRTAKKGAAKKSAARKTPARKSASKARRPVKSAAKESSSRGAARRTEPKNLGDLFLELLKDMYHAEKQILRALPKMAKAAQSDEAKQAFEGHRQQTRGPR